MEVSTTVGLAAVGEFVVGELAVGELAVGEFAVGELAVGLVVVPTWVFVSVFFPPPGTTDVALLGACVGLPAGEDTTGTTSDVVGTGAPVSVFVVGFGF